MFSTCIPVAFRRTSSHQSEVRDSRRSGTSDGSTRRRSDALGCLSTGLVNTHVKTTRCCPSRCADLLQGVVGLGEIALGRCCWFPEAVRAKDCLKHLPVFDFKLVADNFTDRLGSRNRHLIRNLRRRQPLSSRVTRIAVIGTSLSDIYPKENTSLQPHIERHFLVDSKVPLIRYESQDHRLEPARLGRTQCYHVAANQPRQRFSSKRARRPARLCQACSAQRQKLQLVVPESCFRNPQLTWPVRLGGKEPLRTSEPEADVKQYLASTACWTSGQPSFVHAGGKYLKPTGKS